MTNEPAFPVPANEPIHSGTHGMLLRDYFAAKAMLLKFGRPGDAFDINKMAKTCYQMADAMLAARSLK